MMYPGFGHQGPAFLGGGLWGFIYSGDLVLWRVQVQHLLDWFKYQKCDDKNRIPNVHRRV